MVGGAMPGNSPGDTHFKVFKSVAHTQQNTQNDNTPCAPLSTKNYIGNGRKNNGKKERKSWQEKLERARRLSRS